MTQPSGRPLSSRGLFLNKGHTEASCAKYVTRIVKRMLKRGMNSAGAKSSHRGQEKPKIAGRISNHRQL